MKVDHINYEKKLIHYILFNPLSHFLNLILNVSAFSKFNFREIVINRKIEKISST